VIGATPEYGLVGMEMAIDELGSRIKAPATTIGDEEGDHEDGSETLNTPASHSICLTIAI